MRIGFVGFSGPLLYDYGVEASRTAADLVDSPNPLLDSPFGLMLLYDELWFACRSLCPENMRSLDFVRFLDEEGLLPDVGEAMKSLPSPSDDPHFVMAATAAGDPFRQYGDLVAALRLDWGVVPDNHTHQLRVGGATLSANGLSADVVRLDIEIQARLERDDVELIGNSYGQSLLQRVNTGIGAADLAHVLVVDRIPNVMSPKGPYHPVIKDLREDSYLKAFRRWIAESATETTPAEAEKFKASVELRLQEAKEEALLQSFDESRLFYSTAKTLTGIVADLFAPGASALKDIIVNVQEAREARHSRWQGFLISLDKTVRRGAADNT